MQLEAHQQALKDFIKKVPVLTTPSLTLPNGKSHYGEFLSGSPILPRNGDLKAYKQKVEAVTISNDHDFTALTSCTHRGLLNDWKEGGQMTSCNGFAARAAFIMGAPGLGNFNVIDDLVRMNKQHCWITPENGAKPNYGDLFECLSHTPGNPYMNIHVGISLEVEGDVWSTIEGGQGGAGIGVDKVARCRSKFDVSHVLGWVDMKLFLSSGPVFPDWLVGSWVIYAGDQTYNYRFNRYGEVKQLAFRASDAIADSIPPLDKGKVSMAGSDAIRIQWTREGGSELFTYDRWGSFPGVLEKMTGHAADGAALQGVRV